MSDERWIEDRGNDPEAPTGVPPVPGAPPGFEDETEDVEAPVNPAVMNPE
ncbi:MAG: hypothetical protein M3P48_02630 [Actinomycetota bacterium]|nr:hypothetical protein [Actinomycetota bacterium]